MLWDHADLITTECGHDHMRPRSMGLIVGASMICPFCESDDKEIAWPLGHYDGTIETPRWLRWLGVAWKGKCFVFDPVISRGYVLNEIFDHNIIRGELSGHPKRFGIVYNCFLRDEVLHVEGDCYSGSMTLGPLVVTFTLRKRPRVGNESVCVEG